MKDLSYSTLFSVDKKSYTQKFSFQLAQLVNTARSQWAGRGEFLSLYIFTSRSFLALFDFFDHSIMSRFLDFKGKIQSPDLGCNFVISFHNLKNA